MTLSTTVSGSSYCMAHYYAPLDKCVHGITVGGVGNDKNCVHCNEGYCEHFKKVEGALTEAVEGCEACGRAPRKARPEHR